MALWQPVTAQNDYDYRAGILPAINLNKSLNKGWSLNFKYELRQFALQGNYGDHAEPAFEYDLSDFIFLASKKVGLNNTVAGGYLFRWQGSTLIHRTIQQFTFVYEFDALRFAQRISTDQTFHPEEPTTYRLRYRMTFELPLSGKSVDPGEWYVKINNEYLNVLQDGQYDLEIRLVPLFGYDFSDVNKLEIGPDYRINSFLNGKPGTMYWLSMSWFLKL